MNCRGIYKFCRKIKQTANIRLPGKGVRWKRNTILDPFVLFKNTYACSTFPRYLLQISTNLLSFPVTCSNSNLHGRFEMYLACWCHLTKTSSHHSHWILSVRVCLPVGLQDPNAKVSSDWQCTGCRFSTDTCWMDE